VSADTCCRHSGLHMQNEPTVGLSRRARRDRDARQAVAAGCDRPEPRTTTPSSAYTTPRSSGCFPQPPGSRLSCRSEKTSTLGPAVPGARLATTAGAATRSSAGGSAGDCSRAATQSPASSPSGYRDRGKGLASGAEI
jgi:hypothetical protein